MKSVSTKDEQASIARVAAYFQQRGDQTRTLIFLVWPVVFFLILGGQLRSDLNNATLTKQAVDASLERLHASLQRIETDHAERQKGLDHGITNINSYLAGVQQTLTQFLDADPERKAYWRVLRRLDALEHPSTP